MAWWVLRGRAPRALALTILAEYSLIPDIFDVAAYQSAELRDVHLRYLKEVLFTEAVVRDLRDGEWSAQLHEAAVASQPRVKELLTKLLSQKRLRRAPGRLPEAPTSPLEWCREALASNASRPVDGIIAGRSVKAEFRREPLVADIERLASAPWWQARSPSVRLRRQIGDYLRCLRTVLAHANSLMFIDPYIDPSRYSYRSFVELLVAAARPDVPPAIEIHRALHRGSGPDPKAPSWEEIFRNALDDRLRAAGLKATVYIWDDSRFGEDEFHDRYLITDLMGISVPYGFDVSRKSRAMTTWTRLGNKDRDDVQREFDEARGRHEKRDKFTIGSTGR